jgi:hypothetical protein
LKYTELTLSTAEEVISVATFKLDPPPSTNDIGEMRNYLNDMYEQLAFVLSNIDSDNITDDFLSAIGQKGSEK